MNPSESALRTQLPPPKSLAEDPAPCAALLDMVEDLQREIDVVQETRRQWIDIVDSIRDPVMVHDTEYRVMRCNRAYAELAGMDVRQVIGLPYWQAFPRIDGPLLACQEEAAEGPERLEQEFRLPDGEIFVSRSHRLPRQQGEAPRFMHIMQNVTESNRVREAVERSERRYRALTENSSDLVVVVDAEANIVYASPSVKSIAGYEAGEVLGRRYFEFVHPEDLPGAMACFPMAATSPGMIRRQVYRYRCKDGRWVTLETVAKNAVADPLVRGVVVNARDVSERERAERDMRVSEARFRAMFDQAAVGIIQAGTDGTILRVNETLCAMLGYRQNELAGMNTQDITHPDHREASLKLRRRHSARGPDNRYVIEKRYIHKAGHPVWVSVAVSLVRCESEAADYFVAMVQDIGERKRAQEGEREAHALLVAAERLASVGGFSWDVVDNSLSWSDETYRIFGRDPGESPSLEDLMAAVHPEDRGRMQRSIDEVRGGARALDLEFRIIRPDGGQRHMHSYAEVDVNDAGRPLRMIGATLDVTARKLDEERLRRSEERFRGYFELGLIGMAITSPEKGFIEANDKICEILGYTRDELRRVGWAAVTHPEDLGADVDQFDRVLAGDIDGYSLDKRFIRKDGEIVYSTISIGCVRRADRSVDYVVALLQDITERKCAGETLRRSLVATIEAIAATVEARDPYTAGHQRCVADLAAAIAGEMGLPPEQVEGIRFGALIHDLGKVQVPAELLSKPTRLTALESALIKTHPQAGYEIVKGITFPWPVADMVHQHHERLDGSGYPQGLKGDEIALEARILAVADVIEAMASHRPYRPGLGLEAALLQVRQNRGSWFDPDAVDAALRLFEEQGYTLDRTRVEAMAQPSVELACEIR